MDGSHAGGGRPRAASRQAGAWLTGRRVRVHAALLALCLWSFYAFSVATPGLRDRSGLLKGADFLQFYVFGSLARDGGPESLYAFDAHVARARQLVPESEGVSFLPIYGPQVAAFFAPLGGLPYASALACWIGLSALIYALCVLAVWRSCPTLAGRGPVVALLAVAYPPVFAMVGYGQISVLALFIVDDIMKHTGIRTGCNNRRKGRAPGTITQKFMINFGFNLIFPHTGFDKAQQTQKRLFGNFAGLPH